METQRQIDRIVSSVDATRENDTNFWLEKLKKLPEHTRKKGCLQPKQNLDMSCIIAHRIIDEHFIVD